MKNDNHKKKMVAPIIITIVFLAYLIVYGIAAAVASAWSPILILLALPLIAMGIGMKDSLRKKNTFKNVLNHWNWTSQFWQMRPVGTLIPW